MKSFFVNLAATFRVAPRQLALVVGLVVLLAEAMALLALAAPVMMMHLFDGVLESRSVPTLVGLCLLFVVTSIIGGVLYVQRQAVIKAGCALLERKLMVATVTASIRQAREGRAEQANQTLRDFTVLRSFLASSAMNDCLMVLSLPLPLWLMFGLHPVLGYLAVAACLSVAALSIFSERRGRASVRATSNSSSRAAMLLSGLLRYRDEVEGLGLLAGIVRHWMPLRREALNYYERAYQRNNAIDSIASTVNNLFTVAVSAFSAWAIIHHEAAPAAFIVTFKVMPRILGPCQSLARDWTTWGEARMSYLRLRTTLALADAGSEMPPLEVTDPDLHIIGLRLQVPGTEAVLVEDLNLRVQPGSVVVVRGRNGSGKSTLMRALVGLATPAAGTVIFHGVAMHKAERSAIGPRIGFLGQRAQLLNGSILDNICRFDAEPASGFRAARLAGAHDMIGRLPEGYSTMVDWSCTLSSGQQRQVALARALVADAALLVLDEPEVGLDAPAIEALIAAIAMMRARGAIVFLVTHDTTRWQDVGDLELRLDGHSNWTTRLLKPQHQLESV
jgi:ATP-binding cassette subfamily C protein